MTLAARWRMKVAKRAAENVGAGAAARYAVADVTAAPTEDPELKSLFAFLEAVELDERQGFSGAAAKKFADAVKSLG